MDFRSWDHGLDEIQAGKKAKIIENGGLGRGGEVEKEIQLESEARDGRAAG